jgi:type 1 glutamine amidotransferase
MSNEQQWVTVEGTEGPGLGKHIVFISGDEEYRSEEALPMMAQVMAKHHGFKCTVLFAIDPETGFVTPNAQTNIPGMHHVETADMVVMLTRFRELPDADMKYFVDYVFSGKPVLALRTATHAFQYKRNTDSPYAKYDCENKEYDGGFGRQVLGDTWVAHYGHHAFEATRGVPNAAMADHPILTGVESIWCPTDVYEVHPPDDVEVLVNGHVLTGMDPADEDKPDMPPLPVAWIRQPNAETGTGRIFCSTMGAAIDLKDKFLRRLLVNGIYWCMGMESDISPKRCACPVGEYNPSYYGFTEESTNKRPQEFFSA